MITIIYHSKWPLVRLNVYFLIRPRSNWSALKSNQIFLNLYSIICCAFLSCFVAVKDVPTLFRMYLNVCFVSKLGIFSLYYYKYLQKWKRPWLIQFWIVYFIVLWQCCFTNIPHVDRIFAHTFQGISHTFISNNGSWLRSGINWSIPCISLLKRMNCLNTSEWCVHSGRCWERGAGLYL